MPSRRNRRRNADTGWEPSETDESFADGHENTRNISNDSGGTNQHTNTHGYSFASNQVNGGRSDPANGNHSSQSQQKSTFESCTRTMVETAESLQQSRDLIKKLEKLIKQNVNELNSVDEISRKLNELQEDCKQKDEELAKYKLTINTLTSMQKDEKVQIELERAQIDKEKNDQQQWKEKQEKRFQAELAEEKKNVELQYKKRMEEYDEAEKKRKQELEDEIAEKQLALTRKETEFELEKKRLSSTVIEQDEQINDQAVEIRKLKKDYEILRRAMESFENDKSALEAELNGTKKEFALDPPPLEDFEKGFAKIYHQIQGISGKYFHGIEGKDLDQIHKELKEADPLFGYVPIEDSDISRDLCTAHAQRIISQAICEVILTDFSSEFTASQSDSSSILSKISHEIEKYDHGGRTTRFWNARTGRALLTLPAVSASSQPSEATGGSYPLRTSKVISKVFVLYPLVSPTQEKSLRKDLVDLVDLAVDVWSKGQVGGSKLTVSLLLDYANHEEWRSEEFDPVREADKRTADPTSRKIFALFPRVLVAEQAMAVNSGSRVPGGFPEDSNRTTELTVIHTGKGLPESSSLVETGKQDQKEKEDSFNKQLEELKKQYNTPRASGSNRRNSKGSVYSTSPTEQWGKGRTHDFQ